MLVVAAVLLVIFRHGELARFWNTDLETTGRFHQESFFRKPVGAPGKGLQAVEGRLLKAEPDRLVYQFRAPPNTTIYLRPSLVRQSELKDQQQQRQSYRDLKRLKLVLPREKREEVLFDVAGQTTQRIALSPLLGEAPVFELVLDQAGRYTQSERVIGSLDILLVDKASDDVVPELPLYAWMLIAPVLWAWLLNRGLQFSLAASLGLATLLTLGAQIVWVLLPEQVTVLLSASVAASLLTLGLRSAFEKTPLPTPPFFWGLIGLALSLRWQEIVLQATRPLSALPEVERYFIHAVSMDLFSDKGFFSALYPQGPLYPFGLKLLGWFFGFSGFHMFYLSLLCGVALLVLAYRLSRQLLLSGPLALGVMAILTCNLQLIALSAQRSPDTLSACLELALMLVIFARVPSVWLRGLLRGSLLLLLLWNHLSFLPLALLLLLADLAYQTRRSHGAVSWGRSLRSGLISLTIVGVGFVPMLWQNWESAHSFVPESTAYVTRMGNLEFADQPGFPASLDVIRQSERARHYQRLEIRQYFLELHTLPEVAGAFLLGLIMLALDSAGSLLQISTGENILGVLIHGLSSQQNLLPIGVLFGLEIALVLGLSVFAWLRYRRYRFLLVVVLLLMLPHAFFFGLFLLKGLSLHQSLLDQQVFLFVLPVLAIMAVDALAWCWQHLNPLALQPQPEDVD